MAIPQGVNQRWSIDFVQDALDDGRRFRMLNVVDDFTRECLASVLDTSLSGSAGRARARSALRTMRQPGDDPGSNPGPLITGPN